ncbi:MAG: glutathione S-transferase [Halioglobus sp.]|jgi:glutathione S-transferase
MGHELHSSADQLSANNAEALVLYGSAPSPCARRVIICLLEKRLDFDWIEVDLPNMEQRSSDYLALNPNGFVPTLIHGDHVVFESGVILEYLEEQFPDKPLLPADPYERAQARMWMSAEGAMAKIFRPVMYQRLMGPVLQASRTAAEADKIIRRSTNDPTDIEWEQKVWRMEVLMPQELASKTQQLLDWADIVERALQGKNFLVGNTFSMADVAVYPRVAMYPWCGPKLSADQYPNLNRWASALEQHPSFIESLPEQAKKLAGLASSPVLPALTKSLSKAPSARTLWDKSFLFVIGKILRKVQGVDKALQASKTARSLPLPPPSAKSLITKPSHRAGSSFSGDLELYSFSQSPHCQRITLLMDQLGLSYRTHHVDYLRGEHQSTEFLARNPLGELPVLKHGDRIVYNSEVIAEYLISEFCSAGDWQPADSIERSKHRMWLAHESGTHKELIPLWDRYVAGTATPQPFTTSEENALGRIYDKLQKLEVALGEHSFLLGPSAQFADIAWHTQLQSLKSVPQFSLQELPCIAAWNQSMTLLLGRDTAVPIMQDQKPSIA